MQRGLTTTFALLVIAGMGFLVTKRTAFKKSDPEAINPDVAAVASAPIEAALPPDAGTDAPDEPEVKEPVDDLERVLAGQMVPPLPDGSPKKVEFGVVLFTYRGAQGAAPDAPSKETAFKRAVALLTEAQQDFGEAVKKGDPGSHANAGRMPRGILEPALEYVLFTMAKGSVFPEPIDTPRGFWILRRVE